jgi:hypothetical protein
MFALRRLLLSANADGVSIGEQKAKCQGVSWRQSPGREALSLLLVVPGKRRLVSAQLFFVSGFGKPSNSSLSLI